MTSVTLSITPSPTRRAAAAFCALMAALLAALMLAHDGSDRGWTSERTSSARYQFDQTCKLGQQRCDAVFDCILARLSYSEFIAGGTALQLGEQASDKFYAAMGDCSR